MPGVLEGAECYKRSFQFRRAPGMDGMGVWQVATRPLCVRMASNCISRIEGAYIRIVGASAPTKRYKITPLNAGAGVNEEK